MFRLGVSAFAGLSACGDAPPRNEVAPGNQAERVEAGPCAGLSKRLAEDEDRPETWTRSDYDQCMAKEANKTRPADEQLCNAASGSVQDDGRCVLVIL